MGREEEFNKAKQARELAQLHQDIAAAPKLMDRFGRPLLVGGTYVFTPAPSEMPTFEIVDITPVLDVNVPPGIFRVTMACSVAMHAKHLVRVKELMIIGMPQAKLADAVEPAAEPPSADPPPAGEPATEPPTTEPPPPANEPQEPKEPA